MASLSSKISSAVKSGLKTASTVKNAAKNVGSNLAKQASALAGSLTASASAAPKVSAAPNMSSAVTGQSVNSANAPKVSSAPNMTSAVTRKPVNSASAPKVPNMTSAVTRTAVNSSDAPRVQPTANMTDSRTMQSTAGVSSRPSNGGSQSNALRNILGGSFQDNGARASDGGPGVSNSGGLNSRADTYRGIPGVSMSFFSSGQPQSLEAQAQRGPVVATPEGRAQNRAVITEWDSSAPQREAQIAALSSSLREIQAAKDAMAATPLDPAAPQDEVLAQLQEEQRNYEEEEEDLQREIERLSRPSEEYLEAQRQEDELIAKEQAIKAGVNRTTAEISSQPIPYGFVTGQSAAVERRANADLDTIAAQRIPLQQRLANEQARRAAALDVVKSSASRIGSRRDRASDRVYDYQSDTRKNKRDDEKDARDFAENKRQFDVTNSRLRSNETADTSSYNNADTTLLNARGEDGYTDPNLYARLRAQAKSAAEFDRKFSYLVNPLSKVRLGLAEANGLTNPFAQ